MVQYKSYLKDNLRTLRESKGLTQDELANAARKYWPDISRSSVAVIESRDRPVANTDVMKAFALAKALGVSIDDLVLNKAGSDKEPGGRLLRTDHVREETLTPKRLTIPFLKSETTLQSDGSYALLTKSQIINFEVSQRFVDDLPANTGAHNLKMVIGDGHSMSPMFGHGDLLIADTGVKAVQGDGVYFFRINEHSYIKILETAPSGIRAVSKNEDYSSWTISKDMDFEVLARILRVWEGKDPV